MAGTTIFQEQAFVEQLKQRLRLVLDWKVEEEKENGQVDLIVEDPQSGKRMFIEFKQAGRYGQLPVSTVLSMNKQKNRLSAKDMLCLVSFSDIPMMLDDKLKELGIMTIEKPSVEDAAGKIEQVMLAGG